MDLRDKLKRMSQTVLGIDEAGRGCVIGPMVIGGVLVDKKSHKLLSGLGVKDSKRLSHHQRRLLQPGIMSIARDYKLVEVSPALIDQSLGTCGLNVLEAKIMAEIIVYFQPSQVYVDAPGKAGSYKILLEGLLPKKSVRIISTNFADQIYPVVSSASILAKLRRDELIERLHPAYGDFGSGYPSDKKTIAFLEKWYKKHGTFPHFVRTSWRTVKRLSFSSEP